MKAMRFVGENQPLELCEVETPSASKPDQVVVRLAGAGVCRTDLHILEGANPLQPRPPPPFTLGHENSGWVEEVGSEVTGFRKGDPVILHPAVTCGLTAYHAVKRIAPFTYPGAAVVVIGVGGLGHFGVQLLRALTPARVIAIDVAPERLEFADRLGAECGFLAKDPRLVEQVRARTGGQGADVVLDFVAERETPELAVRLLRRGGTYSIVGYGGTLTVPTVNMIAQELHVMGNFVGTYRDLRELMDLNHRGLVKISMQGFPLDQAAQAIEELRGGRILGRAVLLP